MQADIGIENEPSRLENMPTVQHKLTIFLFSKIKIKNAILFTARYSQTATNTMIKISSMVILYCLCRNWKFSHTRLILWNNTINFSFQFSLKIKVLVVKDSVETGYNFLTFFLFFFFNSENVVNVYNIYKKKKGKKE